MGEIICRSGSGIELNLNIDERVTVIGGLSASGKTYVINAIKNTKKNSYDTYSNIDVSRFIVIDDELNISNINNVNNDSIVFIDRYDSFSYNSKTKIWEKMTETKAIWIIMTRNPDFPSGISCSTKSFKELQYTKNNKHIQFNLIPGTL